MALTGALRDHSAVGAMAVARQLAGSARDDIVTAPQMALALRRSFSLIMPSRQARVHGESQTKTLQGFRRPRQLRRRPVFAET